jgi:hypothetical protein
MPLRRPRRRWGVILKLIFSKWGVRIRNDSLGQNRDQWWGPFEDGNETSGSINGSEFIVKLSDYELLTKETLVSGPMLSRAKFYKLSELSCAAVAWADTSSL